MGLYPELSDADLVKFLKDAAEYFRNRPTGGEDMAFWANVTNAERCEQAALRLEIYSSGASDAV